MKCDDVAERLYLLANDTLTSHEKEAVQAHVAGCRECRDALRGAVALNRIRSEPLAAAPDGLFDNIVDNIAATEQRAPKRREFWLGTLVGGSLAAAMAIAVVTLGVYDAPVNPESGDSRFRISLDEPRSMNLAFDLKRPMNAATLSVSLIGGVELVGYESMRELRWTDDLVPGINKLTLPLIATDGRGGKVLVRLSHPSGQKEFLVDLELDRTVPQSDATKSGTDRLTDNDDSDAGAQNALQT